MFLTQFSVVVYIFKWGYALRIYVRVEWRTLQTTHPRFVFRQTARKANVVQLVLHLWLFPVFLSPPWPTSYTRPHSLFRLIGWLCFITFPSIFVSFLFLNCQQLRCARVIHVQHLVKYFLLMHQTYFVRMYRALRVNVASLVIFEWPLRFLKHLFSI